MKKITLILSLFILACAGSSFAQTQVKATTPKTPVKDVAATPATGPDAGKPKPKPKPAPKPSGGRDYLLELDGVKGESKDKSKDAGRLQMPIGKPGGGTPGH